MLAWGTVWTRTLPYAATGGERAFRLAIGVRAAAAGNWAGGREYHKNVEWEGASWNGQGWRCCTGEV